MIETTTEIALASHCGRLGIDELGDPGEEVEVYALLPDDRLVIISYAVLVNGYPEKVVLWAFEADTAVQMPIGLYAMLENMPAERENELARRKTARRGTKRFEKFAPFAGDHVFRDIDMANDIVELGWAKFWAEYYP